MKLLAEELKWITERMKTYRFKHGEIYHEILDHIITAIEQKCEAADNSNIETLFQQVVDQHFGGDEGIQDLVIKQESIYKQSIKNIWWQSLKYHFTWPMLGFIIVALFLSLRLPNVKQVRELLAIGCILLACSPVLYAFFKLKGRVLRSIEGKQSFLRIHLIGMASAPSALLSFLTLYSPFNFIRYLDYISPIILMAVMMLFLLMNLASIHFCRQFTTLNPTTK